WLQKQGFKSLVAKYAKELDAPSAAIETMASVAPSPQSPEAARPTVSARPKSNKPFTTEDYELICNEAVLNAWMAKATAPCVVGLALETDGSGANEASLVGLSFALLEGPWGNFNSRRRRGAYLPIGHRSPGGAVSKEMQGALDLAGD